MQILSTSFQKITFFVLILLSVSMTLRAQEEAAEKDTRPVRNMFESIWLIDNQTVVVPIKGTFEFDIQHRFGTWDLGYDQFYGVFAPSNIRMAFNFVPMENLQTGIGFIKDKRLIDLYAKYAIFQQGRSGGSPVSVSYLVNMAIDSREKDKSGFKQGTDHFSYFHSLMVARKVSEGFSVQASGNVSYFNQVNETKDNEGNVLGRGTNLTVSGSMLARVKVTGTLGLIANFDIPFTQDDFNDPKPNISFGVEMTSSSHAFQIFAGRYNALAPQYNHAFNSIDDTFLIGFNLTRLWNF